MAEFKADVLVLGAGMVGVGAALHLQQRGRDVILVDRHEFAGEETSFGNAGMIECASVFPYMFPRDFAQILRHALNRAPQVRYSFADLPSFLPWLLRYYLASAPDRALRGALAVMPLIRRSLVEHEALMAEAGALELLRRCGWIKMYRKRCNTRQGACGISSERNNTAFRAKSSTTRRSSSASLTSAANSPVRSISPNPASCSIRAGWPRPMPRCSTARADASWSAMRRPWNRNPAGDGRSLRLTAR